MQTSLLSFWLTPVPSAAGGETWNPGAWLQVLEETSCVAALKAGDGMSWKAEPWEKGACPFASWPCFFIFMVPFLLLSLHRFLHMSLVTQLAVPKLGGRQVCGPGWGTLFIWQAAACALHTLLTFVSVPKFWPKILYLLDCFFTFPHFHQFLSGLCIWGPPCSCCCLALPWASGCPLVGVAMFSGVEQIPSPPFSSRSHPNKTLVVYKERGGFSSCQLCGATEGSRPSWIRHFHAVAGGGWKQNVEVLIGNIALPTCESSVFVRRNVSVTYQCRLTCFHQLVSFGSKPCLL